jgi:hypothetical protein
MLGVRFAGREISKEEGDDRLAPSSICVEVGWSCFLISWCSDAGVVQIGGVAEGFYVLLRECSTVKKYGE